MKTKKRELTRKGKFWTIGACIFAVFALSLGLVFGMLDFSSKAKPDKLDSATAPTNSTYWHENPSSLDFVWSGSGTEDDPWLISSAAELATVSYNIYANMITPTSTNYYYYGKYFKQTANIDVSAYYWTPIGSYNDSKIFAGNFDGNGYTISGIFTKAGKSDEDCGQGLFGYVGAPSGALPCGHLSNITVQNSIILGNSHLGGIAGYIKYGTVTNCVNSAQVKTSMSSGEAYVGGLFGYASTSTNISKSNNSGTVNGSSATNIGGLVGFYESSGTSYVISQCYNTGTVSGGTSTGGLVGESRGIIQDCYNKGSVNSASAFSGGIVGWTNYGKIFNCYNNATITSGSGITGNCGYAQVLNCFNIGSGVYGVIGSRYNTNVSKCYYGGTCSATQGIGNEEDEEGITESVETLVSDVKNSAFYNPNSIAWDKTRIWNFTTVWGINANINSGFPTFKYLIPPTLTINTNGGAYLGSTTITQNNGTTVTIKTPTRDYFQFAGWTLSGGGTYVAATNTYTFGTSDGVLSAKWTATHWPAVGVTNWAGSGSAENPYIIDSAEKLAGIAKQISGGLNFKDVCFKQTKNIDLSKLLWAPIAKDDMSTFVGNYDGGNFTISGMRVVSETKYGGLFGFVGGLTGNVSVIKNIIMLDSSVEYKEANSNLTASVGSIIGRLGNSSIIENCSSDAIVRNGYYTGGIVGQSQGTINNCSFTGTVTSVKKDGFAGSGGIAGSCYGTMNKCYFSGYISAVLVGGLVGDVGMLNGKGTINDSIVSGTVSWIGDGTGYAGSIVGAGSGTLNNCAAYGVLLANGANSLNINAIAGYMPNNTSKNCSFVGISDFDFAHSTNTVFGIKSMDSCYVVVNELKYYSDGDFADFAIVSGMNKDLPMQKALYILAEQVPHDSVAMVDRMKAMGFVKKV